MNTADTDRAFQYLCVDDFMKTVTDARSLATAFEIKLVDILAANRGMNFDMLLQATGVDSQGLALLLLLLESNKVVEENHGLFTLTGHFFRALEYRDLMEAKLDFANFAARDFIDLFSLLVKNPREFMGRAHMFRLFAYGRCSEPSPSNYAVTRQWMRFTTALTRYEAAVCMKYHEFSQCRRLLDVGGNSGEFMLRVCRNHKNLTASVFDLPLVCDIGEKHIAAEPEAQRISFIRGNILADPLPSGFDLVTFKSMLHDWPDNRAQEFMAKAADALVPGGTLLIFERAPFDETAMPLQYSAIPFLLFFNAFRRPGFYAEWLEKAGFRNIAVRQIDLEMPFSLISGVKSKP